MSKKPIKKLKVIKSTIKDNADSLILVKASKTHVKSFLDFIRSSSVLGLSVGIVLGGAVGVMVRSLIENVIMPPLGLLFGSPDGIKGLAWTLGKTSNDKLAVLHYGVFLNDLINFIVIAWVVYMIVKLFVVKPDDKKK